MMKTLLYLMANDTKWLELETELPFTPYPGMSFEGLAKEQPLKISGMSYDVPGKFYKLRLAWLSSEPLNSEELIALDVGWQIKT